MRGACLGGYYDSTDIFHTLGRSFRWLFRNAPWRSLRGVCAIFGISRRHTLTRLSYALPLARTSKEFQLRFH